MLNSRRLCLSLVEKRLHRLAMSTLGREGSAGGGGVRWGGVGRRCPSTCVSWENFSCDSERNVFLPLKLGLILASYPEVLPMSLSRKSEGDIGLGAERAASASLEAARLRRERENTRLMVVLLHALIRPQSCSAM